MTDTFADIWTDRRVKIGYESAEDLARKFNEANWRGHPENQASALDDSLDTLGWVGSVKVNLQTQKIFDGHLRVTRALLKDPSLQIPVDYYDLTPDEELLALQIHDAITEQAQPIPEKLAALMERTKAMTADRPGLAGMLAELKARANGLKPDELLGVPKDAKPNPRNLPIDVIFTLENYLSQWTPMAYYSGWKWGIQSSEKVISPNYNLHYDVTFVDNEYKNYNHQQHCQVVKRFTPKYCTTRDLMTMGQCQQAGIEYYSFEQVMEQAAELEQYAQNVIIIPKYDCLDKIPEKYMLGYSVPTSHGGTPLPVAAFKGRRIHLLGGSWKAQLAHMAELGDDVVSVDNNYIHRQAEYGQFVYKDDETNDIQTAFGSSLPNAMTIALAISLGMIAAKVNELYQHKQPTQEPPLQIIITESDGVKLATLDNIDHIKQVAKKYTKELGFILRPALEEAVKRGELLYHPLTGAFCHYHRRRDGVSVIYEICTPTEARGQGLGKKMIDILPLPIELKCPVDNESNKFYEHIGFKLIGTEPGKKRQLNKWRLDYKPPNFDRGVPDYRPINKQELKNNVLVNRLYHNGFIGRLYRSLANSFTLVWSVAVGNNPFRFYLHGAGLCAS